MIGRLTHEPANHGVYVHIGYEIKLPIRSQNALIFFHLICMKNTLVASPRKLHVLPGSSPA